MGKLKSKDCNILELSVVFSHQTVLYLFFGFIFMYLNISVCQPGTARNSTTGECYRCPRGTFSAGLENNQCTLCPEGKSSREGSDDPEDCHNIIYIQTE